MTQARGAMDAAEMARQALANDTLDGVPAAASGVRDQLQRAAEATDDRGADEAFARGIVAADHLAEATDLEAARRAFSDVSEVMFHLAGRDPRLQEGWTTFRCPMVHDGFAKWFQRGTSMENPYMGQDMLTCGFPEDWGEVHLPDAAPSTDSVAYHTCPMHPSVRAADPDERCPICGMELVPVSREALASGEVIVDGPRRQELGIRTAPVREGSLQPSVHATGVVTVDDASLVEVTSRVAGFVEAVHVGTDGERVQRGQRLVSLYSPELWATQQDLFAGSPERVAAARTRLELFGIAARDIDAVVAAGAPTRALPLRAPAAGTVLEESVVQGAQVVAGQTLYRISDLSTLWVEAKVFDAGRVQVGQTATVQVADVPGRTWLAQVARVLPARASTDRAERVRLAVDDPEGQLQIGMFASVVLAVEARSAVLAPREAVIFAGERRVVFVDRGGDRLVPTEVVLGRRGPDDVEVLEGLLPGDQVVISGNFLVAAESRLHGATGFWARPAGAQP